MVFNRQISLRWQEQVPGARWFRCDLHLHTLDDHFSPRLKRPSGLAGPAIESGVQNAYARAFLKSAIERGVEVLGLTPHCVRAGSTDETSVTWRIVEMWNSQDDDDGIPFRDKIFAVFPGFEPSLSDGARGVHLLFLFDPEIGRDCFLRAFQAVMGGVDPWDNGTLRNSSQDAKTVFEKLDYLRREEKERWGYICLAPHAFATDRGLFGLKSQILQDFPHDRIRGLELGDNTLPEDRRLPDWFENGMRKYRHAFFHASDAYALTSSEAVAGAGGIGCRITMMKLARPSIEALRQAFLASDSRLRICYKRNQSGDLELRDDLPDPLAPDRPWIKSITLSGGTSFFGGFDTASQQPHEQKFMFSPDLSCVIGGRMSGKSTLLDGLRVYFSRTLPAEEDVKKGVEERADLRFLSGNPTITPDVRGPVDPTAPLGERWPAQFYTQRELFRAVSDQDGLRKLLFHLIPEHTAALLAGQKRLTELDNNLGEIVQKIAVERTSLAEAEQTLTTAKTAKQALDRFEKVGVDRLSVIQQDLGAIDSSLADLRKVRGSVASVEDLIRKFRLPQLEAVRLDDLKLATGTSATAAKLLRRLRAALRLAAWLAKVLENLLNRTRDEAANKETQSRKEVQDALVHAGGSAEQLNQFDSLARSASKLEVNQAEYKRARESLISDMRRFGATDRERRALVATHRQVMASLAQSISVRFEASIRLLRVQEGVEDSLRSWILGLREKGISRWWNERHTESSKATVGSRQLLRALLRNRLHEAGMSSQVAETFRQIMTSQRRAELRSLRNEDFYELELRLQGTPSTYRRMSNLSGGAQVSVLLSLILRSNDASPLIIDQPEDELDKTYLFDTVLPALRALKGRRQVIIATHDANVVVNGDADQVIYLKATKENANIAAQGAIEEEAIKAAVLTALDGGREAFSLRKAKYGF